MPTVIARAVTDEERHAVYRFRYDVYVTEMGRYGAMADHEHERLVEPEDAHSVNYIARDGDEVVGAFRMTFGMDGFSPRQVEQYSLQPFIDEIPTRAMAIGERLMVSSKVRGAGVVAELIEATNLDLADRSVQIVFGDCEPHLLPLYLSIGSRPYADRNINSAEAGYLIPLISFFGDPEDLVGLGGACTEDGRPCLPSCVQRAMSRSGAIKSAALASPDEYWSQVHDALERMGEQMIHAFAGLNDEEIKRCLARSSVIECAVGDRVLKKGGSSHNLFVVLDGVLEVRDDDRVVSVLVPGDVFGEMAFLLSVPRQRDVYAVAAGTRILSLSEGSLRGIIADDAVAAAKLLLNISKMLCARLINAH